MHHRDTTPTGTTPRGSALVKPADIFHSGTAGEEGGSSSTPVRSSSSPGEEEVSSGPLEAHGEALAEEGQHPAHSVKGRGVMGEVPAGQVAEVVLKRGGEQAKGLRRRRDENIPRTKGSVGLHLLFRCSSRGVSLMTRRAGKVDGRERAGNSDVHEVARRAVGEDNIQATRLAPLRDPADLKGDLLQRLGPRLRREVEQTIPEDVVDPRTAAVSTADEEVVPEGVDGVPARTGARGEESGEGEAEAEAHCKSEVVRGESEGGRGGGDPEPSASRGTAAGEEPRPRCSVRSGGQERVKVLGVSLREEEAPDVLSRPRSKGFESGDPGEKRGGKRLVDTSEGRDKRGRAQRGSSKERPERVGVRGMEPVPDEVRGERPGAEEGKRCIRRPAAKAEAAPPNREASLGTGEGGGEGRGTPGWVPEEVSRALEDGSVKVTKERQAGGMRGKSPEEIRRLGEEAPRENVVADLGRGELGEKWEDPKRFRKRSSEEVQLERRGAQRAAQGDQARRRAANVRRNRKGLQGGGG